MAMVSLPVPVVVGWATEVVVDPVGAVVVEAPVDDVPALVVQTNATRRQSRTIRSRAIVIFAIFIFHVETTTIKVVY